MIVLATDPGASGAIVLYGPGVLEVRRDFKRPENIAEAITELAPRADRGVIELVHAMPGQGVTSMFNFGFATGFAYGAYQAAGFSVYDPSKKPLLEILPQRWQDFFWELLRVSKEERREQKLQFDSKSVAAKFLPPATQDFLSRQKDHNTGDALLIALWCQMNPGEGSNERGKDRKAAARAKKKLTARKAPLKRFA